MAHRRRACIVLSALAALNHPAGHTARVRAFDGTAHARRLAFRVVTAIALLAGHRIAGETVAVTFAATRKPIAKSIVIFNCTSRLIYC